MNTLRSLPLIIAIALGITACNYTVGECWPRGEGGGSSEAVAAGGGVIIPGGVGGFGDSPGKQPQKAGTSPPLDCNSDETEAETETESPTENTCQTGSTPSDGTTITVCSDACKGSCAKGVNGFSPAAFKFVVIIPDDGKGDGGGWQAASVVLKVARWTELFPETWACPQITFGMPLRNKLQGKISPEMAASVSAQLATEISHELKDVEQQGIYCFKMKEALKSRIGKIVYGATVTQP